jgi:dTDP-glucose 4,6-dehydratase
VRYFLQQHPGDSIVNLDKLTYAGNPANLADVASDPRYRFIRGDIADPKAVEEAIAGCDAVINFAAETHVDRSIMDPGAFIQTDVYGTFVLLEAVRSRRVGRYVQVSTDEVYGSIEHGTFREIDPLQPSSPYSASKAGGDMMVRAYWVTHRLPVIVTRASNNYGPYQYPEKIIPLFITNALEDKPLPLYGDGRNVRDWLYVLDHCSGLDLVLRKGQEGEIYNIGSGVELDNLTLTHKILEHCGKPASLIQPVKDRPGHDRRYALDPSKLHALGWKPDWSFEQALGETVEWYRTHEGWWRPLKDGSFREYYRKQYLER